MFTVTWKEKAANRLTPGCCSGVGKFSKVTGSGVSPYPDLACPELAGASFQQIFKLPPQILSCFALAVGTVAGDGMV